LPNVGVATFSVVLQGGPHVITTSYPGSIIFAMSKSPTPGTSILVNPDHTLTTESSITPGPRFTASPSRSSPR